MAKRKAKTASERCGGLTAYQAVKDLELFLIFGEAWGTPLWKHFCELERAKVFADMIEQGDVEECFTTQKRIVLLFCEERGVPIHNAILAQPMMIKGPEPAHESVRKIFSQLRVHLQHTLVRIDDRPLFDDDEQPREVWVKAERRNSNDPRDKRIYEMFKAGKTAPQIKMFVNSSDKWKKITSLAGIYAAAKSYAERMGLPVLKLKQLKKKSKD